MHNGEGDTSAATMLQPGQSIRPQLSEGTAISLIESLYGLQVTTIKELNSYVDRNYFITVGSDYSNPQIPELWPHGYVFKVLNPMDSHKKHVDAEGDIQRELHKSGFNCSQPVLNVHGQDYSLEKINAGHMTQRGAENNNRMEEAGPILHIVRLLTFQPGILLYEIPYTAEVLHQVGKYVGAINHALHGFSHPALTSHQTLWNLVNVPRLTEFLYAITDKAHHQLIEDVITTFTHDIIPRLEQFQRGVIHGDFNDQNIIVIQRPQTVQDKDKQYDIHAVIDFGESADSYYVFEVAIAIMYMMVESSVIDPMKVGGHVLAGYLSQQPLTDVEFDSLKVCVAGRYAQSLVMGAYSYSLDPGNEYLLVTAKNGWPQLKRLWDVSREELYKQWKKTIQAYNL